jgi:hypothetical protein
MSFLLFQKVQEQSLHHNGNVDNKLQEPLLSKHKPEAQMSPTIPSVVVPMRSFKILSFVTGATVALILQWILSVFLWNESILTKSTLQVVIFSLNWSFWTCLGVFSCMLVLVRLLQNRFCRSNVNRPSFDDEAVFQIEAHFVVASLLAISFSWLLNDMWTVQIIRPMQIHPILTIFAAATAYAIFFRYMVCQQQHSDNKELGSDEDDCDESSGSSAYLLISATLGVVFGVSSQFLLTIFLWKDNMTIPMIDNVVFFSLVWSILTVLLTFVGCMSLRVLVGPGMVTKIRSAQRTLLRMEAVYISCSLVGICMAWIFIDVLAGMPEQIIPSMIMLLLSLVAFQIILRCFPEDQCIDSSLEIETTMKLIPNHASPSHEKVHAVLQIV